MGARKQDLSRILKEISFARYFKIERCLEQVVCINH